LDKVIDIEGVQESGVRSQESGVRSQESGEEKIRRKNKEE
jgi:hypothetical protein